MCGGGDVKAPEPTPEERGLQAQQLAILQQQQAENEMLKPVLLSKLGYKIVNGQMVPMSEDERYAALSEQERQQAELEKRSAEAMLGSMSLNQQRFDLEKQSMEAQKQAYAAQLASQGRLEERTLAQLDLDKAMQERQMAALEGRLPVSPAMEQSIEQQRKNLERTLSVRLGPNWATTTPGIQSMQQFNQSAEIAREEARRGQIAQGAQILAPYQSSQLRPEPVSYTTVGRENMAPYLGMYSTQNLGVMDRIPGLLQPYQAQRQMQLQAATTTAQNRSQRDAALIGMVGQVAGMAAGVGLSRMVK